MGSKQSKESIVFLDFFQKFYGNQKKKKELVRILSECQKYVMKNTKEIMFNISEIMEKIPNDYLMYKLAFLMHVFNDKFYGSAIAKTRLYYLQDYTHFETNPDDSFIHYYFIQVEIAKIQLLQRGCELNEKNKNINDFTKYMKIHKILMNEIKQVKENVDKIYNELMNDFSKFKKTLFLCKVKRSDLHWNLSWFM